MDTPQSRNEAILQNILGASNTLLDPESRIEELLQLILVQDALNTQNFELIETVEVEDSDVSSIDRTDLDYSKVFIRARIAAGECGTVQTAVSIDGTDYNCGWWAENTSGGVADTYAKIENSMFFSEYGSQMTSLSASGNNTTLARREISWGQLIEGNIEEIHITSSKYFPVGTEIYIYAVNAANAGTNLITEEHAYLVTD